LRTRDGLNAACVVSRLSTPSSVNADSVTGEAAVVGTAVSPVGGITAVGCSAAVGATVFSTRGGGVAAGAPQAERNRANRMRREIGLFISYVL
jgi:hypothetical protein